ncbi:MAG: 4Fe-4S dicluster domain-containing protein [Ignavibacteriales bacterium]|nr:4Fe-4S dicluster domain-containing protein [Ignavibacteriales bacterium]
MSTHEHQQSPQLSSLVHQRTSVSVSRCYQCGKCSAGCPTATEMDLAPSVILRHLQCGLPSSDNAVLSSYTIWLCLSCHTCVARCPMEVDLPAVMDVLRSESVRQKKVHPRANDILAFHQSFLNTIQRFGRLWEIGLIAEYKLRTWHLLQDVLVAPSMFLRGKLALLPERIKGKKETRRIFDAMRSKEEHHS